MLLLVALLSLSADPAPKTLRIAVLDINVKARYDADRRDVFAELLQGELRDRGFSVIGRSDIEALLGFEKVKDAVACSTTSCLAELGGALGVDELITGTISKLSSYLVISLKRTSPRHAQVIKQVTRKLSDGGDRELIESVGSLVSELYGAPAIWQSGGQGVAPRAAKPRETPAAQDQEQETEPKQSATGVAVVTFTVASSSKSYEEVMVQHKDGTAKCDKPVTYLQSCTLTVTSGPAHIVVSGHFEDDKELPVGQSNYKIEYRPSWPTWLGVGVAGAGVALMLPTVFSGVCQAPPGATVKPKNADPAECPLGFGLLLGGAVLAAGGAFLALFAPPGGNHSTLTSGTASFQLRAVDLVPMRGGAYASVFFTY